MLPSRTRKADFGAMCEFKILIDNPLLKDDAPKSVFLRRLGSTMFQITGHTGWCMADFTKLIAPKFFALNYTGLASLVPTDPRLHQFIHLPSEGLWDCGGRLKRFSSDIF